MPVLVPTALIAWIPLTLVLFAVLPARKAVIIAFIFGWLFLPTAGYKLPGFLSYTKTTATSLGILLGACAFDPGSLLKFRPKWLDIPMVIWCLCPIATSLANDLGLYDGLSEAMYQSLTWGVPYFLGRVYLSGPMEIRELAIAIFVGGLVYVPLCLFEIKMSPQLLGMVYGIENRAFTQTMRMGGWRPVVFLNHGLMLGFWMSAASLCGFWLWKAGGMRTIGRWPANGPLAVLIGTTVLCKSTGALILLLLGIAALLTSKSRRVVWPLIAAVAIPPLYTTLRATGIWSGESLVAVAASVTGPDRAQSLEYRLKNENLLSDHALEQPVFGWGGWGRYQIVEVDEDSREATPDGLWVIALGKFGIVGLASIMLAGLLPVLQLARRRPPSGGPLAGAEALAVVLSIYMMDNLMNAMVNPVFALGLGGLTGVAIAATRPIGEPPRRAVVHRRRRVKATVKWGGTTAAEATPGNGSRDSLAVPPPKLT